MENWAGKSTVNKLSAVDTKCWFVRDNANQWHLDPDCERRPLRKLVIHHLFAAAAQSADWKDVAKWLSENHEEQLYAPVFSLEKSFDPYLFGLPLHSGHVTKELGETFAAYHHLIFADGTVKTLLIAYRKIGNEIYVDMVGWHAGNWRINVESVAIAFVDHLKRRGPTPRALASLDKLVAHYRGLVPDIQVLSHREARGCNAAGIWGTVCPGPWFEPWAATLLSKNRPNQAELPTCKKPRY